jgi:hypothetical protein
VNPDSARGVPRDREVANKRRKRLPTREELNISSAPASLLNDNSDASTSGACNDAASIMQGKSASSDNEFTISHTKSTPFDNDATKSTIFGV